MHIAIGVVFFTSLAILASTAQLRKVRKNMKIENGAKYIPPSTNKADRTEP